MGNWTVNSWYKRTFTVPNTWTGDRVLLNFEAVDYEATVFVNTRKVGFHRGGYFSFSFDVTDYLSTNGTNELYANISYSSFRLQHADMIQACLRL